MEQSVPPKRSFWQRVLRCPEKKPKPKVLPTHSFKDSVVVILTFFVCLLAIFQEMETLAIAALLMVGVIVYKYRVGQAIDIGFELLHRARTAKIGSFEFEVEKNLRDYSRLLDQQSELIHVILSELTSDQISLLLAIYKAGRYEAREKNSLRALRSHGLLLHNASSMTESTEVWLTDFGKNVAENLLQSTK